MAYWAVTQIQRPLFELLERVVPPVHGWFEDLPRRLHHHGHRRGAADGALSDAALDMRAM